MLFDNIELYTADGQPIQVVFICGNCGKKMDHPYEVKHDPRTGEEWYKCANCCTKKGSD